MVIEKLQTVRLLRYGRRWNVPKDSVIYVEKMFHDRKHKGVHVWVLDGEDTPVKYYTWDAVQHFIDTCGMIRINRAACVKYGTKLQVAWQKFSEPRLAYTGESGTRSTPCIIPLVGVQSRIGCDEMRKIRDLKMWEYLPKETKQ